ncbi:hypothetical protein EV652_12146 [Kribbella steppae]|uniref:Uncharacterized protein n=1 Tax=Kribbella steppae TaxID=2512223 RepID=A0A4R2GZV5_9ACTN|nr:hypothetical protein [Kribbella steppae]TCO15673.1 hypothetical protein EV652_12146 [Kribbella steppae]
MSMTYDGAFGVETSLFTGLAEPRSGFCRSSTPPRTGTVLLLGMDGDTAIPLSPWFYCEESTLQVFDGIDIQRRRSPDPYPDAVHEPG